MPTEAPNTLRSRAKFKIVDIISQGPIKGIVNGAKSIFLDETPVQNEDGTYNFPNFDVTRDVTELPVVVPTGATNPICPGIFPASENEVNVGVKVTKNSPEGSGGGDGSVTRTITDANLDAVRVTMRIPALAITNTTTGDITGGQINFNIYVKPNGGDFSPIDAGAAWTNLTVGGNTLPESSGVELTVRLSGDRTTAKKITWQYAKRTGGEWGAWVDYASVDIPATSSSQQAEGFYNWSANLGDFTRSVKYLGAGTYRVRSVTTGGTGTDISARQYRVVGLQISGKTVSPYDVSYNVPLPDGGAPWEIKVQRWTSDNTASNYQDDLYWLAYTEIVDNRFSWPNVAGLRLAIDAESFGGNVPNRSYDVMGLLVQIPANYDPYNRTYTGIWNGTFKTDWTDNPAWIFYDLLTNKRYGLGDNIDSSQIDKYALYQIAQYCDELVDAPNGEQEPRYTCSCVINTQSEAYELLTAIASAFRGMIYHSGGMITPVADMPSDPVLNVGPANVIDGVFTYQGASRKARHTVARVSWNNPDDGYKLNVELYEDDEAIRKYGYRPIDINAFGCTSRGLARRWGKWAIVSDNDAPDTVTYKAGFDHFQLRPGDVINIADPNYSGEQLFGLIADVIDNVSPATHTIKLDRAVTRVAGDTSELQLTLPDGTILALDVAVLANTTTDEITVDSSELTTVPLAGASWLLKKGTVEPRQWRVISISEDEPHIYQVTAMLYDPNKYDSIETGLNFAEADFTAFPSGPLPAPTGLAISEFLKQSGSAILECATFSWVRPADARAELFEVQYQEDGKDWQATTPNLTGVTSVDIINIVPGTYNFRVRAQDSSGIFRSEWATLASQTLQGKNKAPENVTGFTASVEKFGVLLSWNKVSDIDIDYYEIRTGASWAAGTTIGKVKATTFKFEDATTGVYTFWIKALDTQTPANESATAASVSATISAQGTPVVVATSVNGGIQIDIAGAVSRGFSHYEIKRRSYPAGTEVTINDNVLTRRFTDTDITTLGYVTQWQYSVRAIDQNAAASAWSDYTTQLSPKMIETLDITANQIVAKDFRTALDVGATVDGVKFTADGIEMWEDGARKVLIPTSGDPEFAGLLTAAAGYIGGWQIFPTYLQSSNIKLDSAGLLQTLDFVSGNKGWKINQDGNAEFNNIRARGAVKTVVFEKDEISVVGGRTLIRPAGVVKDYDYADFINAAGGAYLEDCWDKLNELLGTNYTYVAPVFADYAEYYAAEMAYYDELCVAMGFNQFACAIEESAYDDATKDAYLTACWSQLMTLLDLTTTTPAIPSMTFAAFKTLENGYFDEVAEAIDNPPVFEPFIRDADTAIETDNADQFAIGDIVRIKDGLASDYWGRVSAISGDIVSITGESGEPFAITAGQTIVNYGIPGSGGILLDGQGPMMDVYTHDGAPWNGTDLRLRIGNLNGWGTINDDIYGIAIGNPTGEYLVYDSTSGRLRLNGAIQISEGTGIANFSDAGALAGLDDIDLSYVTDAGTLASANNLDDVGDGTTYKKTTANEKTGAARAYSGLDANNMLVTAVIPASAVSPTGAGLFLGSNYLGFYSGGWKTYMDNAGNFALIGGGTHGLSWNAATGVLTIAGSISILGGSGYGNLTDKPTNLAGINSTEGGKLAGIEAGADVTSTHTSADTSKVAGTAAATVRDNAANALANAATAQSTADGAVTSAATANGLLADIAADNKFTPVEKQSARKEWDIIATEQPINSLHAMNIVGFSAGISAGSFNETASDAYWSECWTKLNTLLGESNVEPAFAAQTYTAFVAEESSYYTLVKQVIDSEIITVPPSPDILALNSAYVAAFQALATYLNAGSTWSSGVPSWISDANLSATNTIVGATFRGTWKAYYDARTALLNAIAAKSKIIADLAQDTAGSVTLRVDTTLDANNRVTTAVIPTTSIAPDRAGLFMGANYMGFHNGDEWKTYMDANGNFALDGAGAHGLSWNAATGTLTVAGNITVQDGSITSDKLTSSQIVGKDIRTAANVGNGTVSGCRMTSAGFEAFQGATRTVFISNTGAASFAGTVTCGSGSQIAGFTATTTDMTAGSGATAIGMSTDPSKKAFWAGNENFYVEHDGTGRIGLFNFTSSNLTASYSDAYWDNNLTISGLEDSDYEWISATSLSKSTGNINRIKISPSGIYHGFSDSADNVQYDVNTFGTGSTVNQSVVTIRALIGDKYAFRCNGNAFFYYNVSALSFTDRTEMPESMEEALEIINTMQPTKGRVDYKRLSNKAKKFTIQKAEDGSEYIEEGRDLTKTVSALIMVVQKLQEENFRLSDRLAKLEKSDTDEEREYIEAVEKAIGENRGNIRVRVEAKNDS